VQGGDPAEPNATLFAQPIVFQRTIYGDSPDTGLTEPQQKQANLRGKIFRHFDGAGILTTELCDFKGNPLRSTRQFARDYKSTPDWSKNPALETKIFEIATAYDALNRVIAATAPDKSIYRPAFNGQSPGKGRRQSARHSGGHAFRHQYRLQCQEPAHAHPI
jgi:hypothetical protein